MVIKQSVPPGLSTYPPHQVSCCSMVSEHELRLRLYCFELKQFLQLSQTQVCNTGAASATVLLGRFWSHRGLNFYLALSSPIDRNWVFELKCNKNYIYIFKLTLLYIKNYTWSITITCYSIKKFLFNNRRIILISYLTANMSE